MSNKDLSLNYIASKRLFVNAAYLGKMFAEVKKEKFARYLTRKRMERARELLIFSPNLLIQEVSIQTGFGCNTQYFCRVFKNWTGYTPSQFREQFRL